MYSKYDNEGIEISRFAMQGPYAMKVLIVNITHLRDRASIIDQSNHLYFPWSLHASSHDIGGVQIWNDTSLDMLYVKEGFDDQTLWTSCGSSYAFVAHHEAHHPEFVASQDML
ncbi:hypothetical protein AMTR_s00017p00171750 [Amborella trichopoda]|uniref:Uncharacterized protein n=1 Tax=Amborella trichopoda TaxID=13333 RepID=W1PF47_AMBTC|nr:hypothetical protein AMTR_s00017p00171750 [Amborella trichopoda]